MRINGSDALESTAGVVRDVPCGRPANEVEREHDDVAVRRDSLEMPGAERGCVREAASFERLVEIRRRIVSGAYDCPDVLDSVARKILDRHDV